MELTGQHGLRLDQKGRIAIPARLRPAFQEGLVLSQGFDRCLTAYPREEWRKRAERFARLPFTRSDARHVARSFFYNAFPAELDGQGRAVLPAVLREYAGIRDELVVVGMYFYLEIWAKEVWEEESSFLQKNAAQLAESQELPS